MADKDRKSASQTQEDPFPRRLKQLRVAKDLSQEDLGNLVDLNYNHIGRYERGESRPSAHKLRAMADALGVTTDYLLGGSEDNSLKADIEDQELLDMFRRVQKLPEDKKRSVKDFLEAYLFRERVREDIA